jgi:transposase
MSQMTLITGPERRRRWSEEQKLSILAAAAVPGAVVSEVARRADICTSLIYRWRQAYRAAEPPPGFAQAVVVDASGPASAARAEPAMVVEFSSGARVRIASTASAELVTAALRALR